VGLFITSAENGARSLRVHVDGRDIAAPPPFGLVLEGEGRAEHGGFGYLDTARFVVSELPAEAAKKASAAEILSYLVEVGGTATPGQIKDRFDISDGTLRKRRGELEAVGVSYVGTGRDVIYTTNPATPQHPAIAGVRGAWDDEPRTPPSPIERAGWGAGSSPRDTATGGIDLRADILDDEEELS
jgi:hypothetical protein